MSDAGAVVARGVVVVVAQASLPQEQHWHGTDSSTECGATNPTACITRSRRLKMMLSVERMQEYDYWLIGQTQAGDEPFKDSRRNRLTRLNGSTPAPAGIRRLSFRQNV